MPRLLSIAVVALALTTVAAGAADDFDRLILKLNGHVTGVGAYVDQSEMGDLDEWVGAVDTGLFGSAILPLDGGGEIGGRIALDLDYSSHVDTFLNDAGRSDILEELWLYWEGRYGRVQMGLMDGAADVLGLTPPSVSSAIRADNPEIYLLAFPCQEPFCSSDPGSPGSLFNPNGMQLRSDVHGSDNFLKIMYVTPVFDEGFRIAISYTPDGTRYLGELFGDDEPNEQANIIDIAASYTGSIGAVDLGLSIGYVFGDNVNNTDPTLYGDLEDFGAGIKLGYREWTAGVTYRQTNVAGGGPVVQDPFVTNVFADEVTDVWSFGLMYETGPWAASANYIKMVEELPFSSRDQEGSALQFALGYTIDERLRVTGGYQRYEFDREFGFCGFFGCEILDANVGYVETTFNF